MRKINTPRRSHAHPGLPEKTEQRVFNATVPVLVVVRENRLSLVSRDTVVPRLSGFPSDGELIDSDNPSMHLSIDSQNP